MTINKESIKYIKLLIITFIIIAVLVSSAGTFNEIMESYYAQATEINYWVYPVALLESIIMGIIKNIYLVGFFVAFLLASRSINRAKLDETDFEKNKTFYRDIIKNYSVSVLNYIDNFKLDYKQSYTAELLKLEKKKIIKITGNKIEILKEPTEELDKRFVDSIKNNKVTMPLSEYENLIQEEALEKGLITKSTFFGNVKDRKTKVIIIIIFLLMFAGAFFIAFVQDADLNSKIFIAIVLSLLIWGFIVFFVFAYFIVYFVKFLFEKNYRRTEKGKEVNRQLDGLKLFMEKFSNIDSKEAQHLILWDDYLIYSVMFNINKKIQDEYSKFLFN